MGEITRLIGHWGYPGIFLVVVLGNLGLPVPEETVLAVAGYLAWSGRLQLVPVLLVGIVSAVAGDNLGYWIGRRYGRAPVERYARWLLSPAQISATERFIHRYGALAVGAARFVSGMRFLAGPLAGSVGMPFRRFLTGNLLGAVLFVPYAVGLGYAVGYGLGPHLGRLKHALQGAEHVVLAVALIVLVVLIGRHAPVRIVRIAARRVLRLLRRNPPHP
jgi:membrane protein DedA with SNARE-associated domain